MSYLVGVFCHPLKINETNKMICCNYGVMWVIWQMKNPYLVFGTPIKE